jgi:hypothetical protein
MRPHWPNTSFTRTTTKDDGISTSETTEVVFAVTTRQQTPGANISLETILITTAGFNALIRFLGSQRTFRFNMPGPIPWGGLSAASMPRLAPVLKIIKNTR